MNGNESEVEISAGKKLLVLSGSALIVLAVVILLFLGFFVYQLFYQPDQVYLIKYLMDTIDLSDKAFFGRIDNAPFYIHISDPIKYFLYFMATFLILSIVVRIFRGILSAGTALIKIANSPKADKE